MLQTCSKGLTRPYFGSPGGFELLGVALLKLGAPVLELAVPVAGAFEVPRSSGEGGGRVAGRCKRGWHWQGFPYRPHKGHAAALVHPFWAAYPPPGWKTRASKSTRDCEIHEDQAGRPSIPPDCQTP